MPDGKRTRLLTAAVIIAGLPLATASAQTEAPKPQTPPPAATPTTPPKPAPAEKSVAAPDQAKGLVGLAVFSSDGSKMGNVLRVASGPDGAVKAIHIKTGGFLGFGGKIVAIPEGRFTKVGDNVQLGISADEVSKLPEVKEQS
jgi:hypothetical protein